MLNRGLDLETIRVILGHQNIATTALYLNLATDNLVRNYKRALEPAAFPRVAA